MRHVLFDTNVVLDMLLDRAPFADAAERLFAYVENQRIYGYLCATTVTTIYYLARKVLSADQTHAEMQKLLRLFDITSVNKIVLESAIASGLPDFEDAVLYESAKQAGVDTIVTRNKQDFPHAEIALYSSAELAAKLAKIT